MALLTAAHAPDRCEKCGFEAQPGDLYATGGFTQKVAPAWWCSLCLAEMQFSMGELRLFPEPTILTGTRGMWLPGGSAEQAGVRNRRLAEVSLYLLSSGMDVEVIRQTWHGYVVGYYLDLKAVFAWLEGSNRVCKKLTVTVGDDRVGIAQLRLLAASPARFAAGFRIRRGRRAAARLCGDPPPSAGSRIPHDDVWRA